MPEGIVTVRISKSTGCPARASDPYEDGMFEVFMVDNVPTCEIVETQLDPFNSAEPIERPPEEKDEDDTLF
jgi:hypothetical protein